MRRRSYSVNQNLEGLFEVIREVEGSNLSTVVETYASEVLAAQVAITLQSFAQTDDLTRESGVPVVFEARSVLESSKHS